MIDQFIAGVKQGMARTNRFKVSFSMPNCLMNGYATPPDDTDLRKIHLFCDQIQIPGVNYSTIQNRTFGEFRETPYEKLYDAVNISFYVDKDMMVKSFFDTWMSGIQDKYTRTFNYYNEYVTDFTLEVLDTVDNTVYIVDLHEAYPKTIGAIQLDQGSKDIMKLSVTMQYKYFRAFKSSFEDRRDSFGTAPTLSSFNSQNFIANPLSFPGVPPMPALPQIPKLPRISGFAF
jgi:hypothetical protein